MMSRNDVRFSSIVLISCLFLGGAAPPSLGAPSSDLNQILLESIENKKYGMAQMVLELGADPNWRGFSSAHDPILLKAITSGNAPIARKLLKYGANPNQRDLQGTPIIIGAIALLKTQNSRKPEILKSILEVLKSQKIDIRIRDKSYHGDKRTPLHAAAEAGLPSLVTLLLKRGANPQSTNRFGETPLHLAASEGHLETVKLLVRTGADWNLHSRFTRQSPLIMAARSGQWEVAKYLISKRSNPTLRDTFGKSAMEYALEGQKNSSDIRLIQRFQKTVEVLERAQTARTARAVKN